MLENFFSSPVRLRQLRHRGPLGPHLDGFAAYLRQAGYTRGSGALTLSQASTFSWYLERKGLTLQEIDELAGQRFIEEDLTPVGCGASAPYMIKRLLVYGRQTGLMPAMAAAQPALTPEEALLRRYTDHLRDVRGLAFATIADYLRYARMLLAWYATERPHATLPQMTAADVMTYLTYTTGLHTSRAWARHCVGGFRAFLRFLHWEAILPIALDGGLPSSRLYRLAPIPPRLTVAQVRQVLDAVDVTRPEGQRNKAILLLLAVLGLRSMDICRLEVSHLDWRQGVIRLPITKGCRARVLPLPAEVGAAIADYLLHGRPAYPGPQVFLRQNAPVAPLKHIWSIADTALRRVGITLPSSTGPHLFRHSLASQLVNAGTPIKEIADLLGHQSIDTTAIYTKVDTMHLAEIALPFPEVSHE
jgi:site-specific recombinase XerD